MRKPRKVLAMLLALVMCLSLAAPALATDTASVSVGIPDSIVSGFANPTADYRAGFRYELPGGEVDQAQVAAEVKAAADAGFAVMEITASGVTDYAKYGLDSDAWRETLKTIYATANEVGIQADIHLSFNNGANLYVPGLEVTDEGVTKRIVEAHTDVVGGTALAVGAEIPVVETPNESRKLVAVLAAKVLEKKLQDQIEPTVTGFAINVKEVEVTYLDPDNIIDVTDSVSYQVADNTAAVTKALSIGAADESWSLIAVYEEGLPNTSNVGTEPARKMDYFSEAGTKAFTDFYDNEVFDDELRALMRENGGDLFSDSYGADSNWTDGFLGIFAEAKDYDLTKYLPVLFSDYFEIAESGTRVRNDVYEVMTELYCKYHLEGLTDWANSLGLKYRDQVVYTALRDMMTAAMYIDIPETESLYFLDEIDNYIAMSAPANLSRKEMVSTELGALKGMGNEAYVVGGYSQTWEDIIIQANHSFAGGVNQMLLHTFPYRDGVNYAWPGFTAFGPSFSESWGPRMASWQDAKDIADYLARGQYIMRQGVSQRDVVIYKHNYDWQRWSGEYILDQTLTREGYTFDFINPAMMQHENATASNGVIDPTGGNYQAFIIDADQHPLPQAWSRPAADMMPVEAAQKIQEYAKAGVPVIVVGEAPSRGEGLLEDDSEVVRIFNEMSEAGQITVVASEADIAGALRDLGIRPAADNNTECGVTSYLRVKDGVNYYFLYNQGNYDTVYENPYTGGPSDCDQVISLKGEGRPYLMNMWTGEVTPIANYTEADGYVNIHMQLDIDEATIIAVGGPNAELYAEEADCDVFYQPDGSLALRAFAAGNYEVVLNDGTTETVIVDAVAAAVTPAEWTLTIESWTPLHPDVKGEDGAETAKTKLDPIELTELKSWKDIPGFETISGIGTYVTTFTVDGPADGAILSLGQVFDTVSVKINGTDVTGINQSTKVIDLGSLVKQGVNTLEIESVSTLRNAVKAVDESYQSPAQAYGILGPVSVTPYRNVFVANGVAAPSVTDFTDVPANAWYAESVGFMLGRGYMTGASDTAFAPGSAASLATAVTALCRFTNGQDTSEADAMAWAVEEGIVTGNPNPASSVTREQLASILYRCAGTPAASQPLNFADAGTISADAQSAVAWCVANGILNGYSDNTICPAGYVTRAETAKMMTAFIQLQEA